MKKLLIMSLSHLDKDPRVFRQIRHLSEKYAVVAAGFSDPAVPGVDYIPLHHFSRSLPKKMEAAFRLLSGQYERFYWQENIDKGRVDSLSTVRPDLIIANDIDTLPLALKVANGAKVIFDAHEYAPREFEDKWLWRLMWSGFRQHLCEQYIPRADRMTTVCNGIADEYFKDFGVRPEVVTNAARFRDLRPSPVDGNNIRMIHHGLALSSRKIELMIEMMAFMDDRFTLDLMLVPSDRAYYAQLQQMAASHKKVRFLEPVPMQEIVAATASYDIGVFLLPPTNFNYNFALPNKFFEFIQARLAIAIGPSPEMARLVKEHDCGVVAPSFVPQEMAIELNRLTTAQVEYFKNQSDKAAFELSEEKNMVKLEQMVEELLH